MLQRLLIQLLLIPCLVVKEMLREEINKFLRTEEMKKIIYDAFSGAVERQFEIDKKEKHDN